jgi:hypothetical protein
LELVMARPLILLITLMSCGLPVGVLQAQLRGFGAPPVAREPARPGLFGGLREAREERFRREEQAAVAAARASAAQRNAALRNAATPPNPTQTPNQRSAEAARSNSSRTANYGGTNDQASRNMAKTNTGNSLLVPSPVIPATAIGMDTAPEQYDGSGVAIRLPKDAPSVVRYLVDDVQSKAIRPGERQILDDKDSYIVRYSRGVTADGRSFGESRYTITEGRYRFELTPTGWELYREPDSDAILAPPNRLDIVESRASDLPIPEPSSQSELRRLPVESQSTEKPGVTPSEPTASEEILPAPKPRSILE